MNSITKGEELLAALRRQACLNWRRVSWDRHAEARSPQSFERALPPPKAPTSRLQSVASTWHNQVKQIHGTRTLQ
eukprot:15454580-Alexandrium_andersonii.AAC.1